MEKFMFDSNIYDKLPEIIEKINSSKNEYEFYITTIQIEELSKIPDSKQSIRERNLLMLAMLRPKLVPLNTAIYDKCRYDLVKYDEGQAYEKILKKTGSNINDALIADTAIANSCTLVTDDNADFCQRVKKKGYQALTYSEFFNMLTKTE